jgi:hypothetical protein
MMHVIDVLLDLFTLGITYFHETFEQEQNREVVFHNNVNSKKLKSIEEIATAVAIAHNLVRIGRK